jgi:hypothetical protein
LNREQQKKYGKTDEKNVSDIRQAAGGENLKYE